MKTWIKTKLSGTAENLVPYLANQKIAYSLMILDADTCLCRIAGTPAQIAAILADAEITEQTDEQATAIIQSKYPNSTLENLDIADPEVDEIAKANGLDPHLRADIKIASRGKTVLQDQENYLMTMISEKKGISRPMWDDEAIKSGEYLNGIGIQRDTIDGKGAAHEFVLSRLR